MNSVKSLEFLSSSVNENKEIEIFHVILLSELSEIIHKKMIDTVPGLIVGAQ